MKRIALIVACVLASHSSAFACHRFSIWRYNYPQPKCQVTPKVDRSWFVEITGLPEDIARQQAIDLLKKYMNK